MKVIKRWMRVWGGNKCGLRHVCTHLLSYGKEPIRKVFRERLHLHTRVPFSSLLVTPKRETNFLNNGNPIICEICTRSYLDNSPTKSKIYILFKIMKSASTLRESSLANFWFSKNSSSSVGIPPLYLRSEKSNIYSYFNLFKMKITVGFGWPSFSKDWYIKESSSSLGIPSIHNTIISSSISPSSLENSFT